VAVPLDNCATGRRPCRHTMPTHDADTRCRHTMPPTLTHDAVPRRPRLRVTMPGPGSRCRATMPAHDAESRTHDAECRTLPTTMTPSPGPTMPSAALCRRP
jgi:hypothetical protein